MPTEMPWSMATMGSGQYCPICNQMGIRYSHAVGLHHWEKGFWKEMRKRIVEHFESEHPEYKITRLSEGPK